MHLPAFDLFLPQAVETPVVFASPHSGRTYPAEFLSQSLLDRHAIRSSEDAFVDRLFGAAPEHGAPLLAARLPRAWVDLNRGPDELDPALIDGVSRSALNPRVSSGLGVIPRVVAGGRAIHRRRLTKAEVEARLANGWHPYHGCLQDLLRKARALFGAALLIDCHSMPREAILSHAAPGKPVPEVVLGDRHGAACDGAIMDAIEAIFVAQGFRVSRNVPFAGAYICQTYGRPSIAQHVVQVEIDRSLYMDENRIVPHSGFDEVQMRLGAAIAEIAELGRGIGRRSLPMAAE